MTKIDPRTSGALVRRVASALGAALLTTVLVACGGSSTPSSGGSGTTSGGGTTTDAECKAAAHDATCSFTSDCCAPAECTAGVAKGSNVCILKSGKACSKDDECVGFDATVPGSGCVNGACF